MKTLGVTQSVLVGAGLVRIFLRDWRVAACCLAVAGLIGVWLRIELQAQLSSERVETARLESKIAKLREMAAAAGLGER